MKIFVSLLYPGDNGDSILPDMDSISVEDFIADLSEHHLLDNEILKVLDTIREAMMNQARCYFVDRHGIEH